MRRTVQILSIWNLICPAIVVLFLNATSFFGLEVSGGTLLDHAAFLFAWAWLLGTPVTAGTALWLNKQAQWKPAKPINIAVAFLWLISNLFLHRLHG